MIQEVYEDFGFKDYTFRLSYRDPEDKENIWMMMKCGIKLNQSKKQLMKWATICRSYW